MGASSAAYLDAWNVSGQDGMGLSPLLGLHEIFKPEDQRFLAVPPQHLRTAVAW